jgi:hypothetical protein
MTNIEWVILLIVVVPMTFHVGYVFGTAKGVKMAAKGFRS